jgi:hypothetical protein
MDWLWFGGVVAVLVAVFGAVFRSLNRWPQSPPRDEVTKQAEARLWSTRSMDQR